MSVPPTPKDIAARAAKALFWKKHLTNVHRAVVVEAIVSSALGDDWEWCSGDYSSCDLKHNDGTRLEIKQSASLQSWNAAEAVDLHPIYDVADLSSEEARFSTRFIECAVLTGATIASFELASGPITFTRTP